MPLAIILTLSIVLTTLMMNDVAVDPWFSIVLKEIELSTFLAT